MQVLDTASRRAGQFLAEQDLLKRMREGVLAGDENVVRETTHEAVKRNIDAVGIIEKGLIPAITEVGAKFERTEIYLTDMMRSAEAMKAGMSIVLQRVPKDNIPKRATVVLGTVKGDIHEIGKNILGLSLIHISEPTRPY